MTERKPISLYVLQSLVGFLSFSAIGGGLILISQPSGEFVGLETSMLDDTPFEDYMIPGIILLTVLGTSSAILTYSMLKSPDWTWPDKLNPYDDQHWIWTSSLCFGFAILIWMNVQFAAIGFNAVIQWIYLILGFAVLVSALMPSVKNYYSTK